MTSNTRSAPYNPATEPYLHRYYEQNTKLTRSFLHVLFPPQRSIPPCKSPIGGYVSPSGVPGGNPYLSPPSGRYRGRHPSGLSNEGFSLTDVADPEALITVDVLIVSPNCPSLRQSEDEADEAEKEELQIVSIQFNSLDVIANQETIVELLGFFKR